MIVVTGEVEVAPTAVEAMKSAAAEMAQATRAEDGCIRYGFWQDIENDTRFRVYEEWESLAALTAHFDTPHMANFRAAMGAAGLVSRNIVRFEAGPPEPV